MMALNGNMLGRMNSANINFCNPLMFSGCIPYNINTNNDIYTAFNTIDKYMLYIQDCLLNVLKENNKFSYSYGIINEIIKEIIHHINKYFNAINNSGSNSSSKKNNMSNSFNNMCWKVNDINDMNAPILAKINEDINKFLCSLMRLSYKTEYKDIVINSFMNNNNENDYCLILNKLNEYISNIQNALLKCLRKKDSILGLSDLIKNIEDFSNEIQRIMPCNSEMQPFGMQMNNCGIQNGLNQCSMNHFSMPMGSMQMNQYPMSMGSMQMNQNPMSMGSMQMNQYPMSMGSMPNQSFRLNLMNQINVIKSTVLNFLKDLKKLIYLNIEGTEYFEPMFSGCIPYNINTNNDIYPAFNTIDKYMLYIQDCLLNVLKENNKFSYSYGIINEIIKEIIHHINKYFNAINNSGSNSSSKKNNMSNSFNNMCWKVNDINDMNAPILAKINEDINKFLCSLMRLSYKTEYKDIVINSFMNNNNENDYCLILNKLNEYISNIQNALLKCLRKKDSILGLSDLIKNIEDFSNEIQRIMPCNSEMQPFGMQMNNCGIQNGLNQCSMNHFSMPMGSMQMNQYPMSMGSMQMNQNPMSMGSMQMNQYPMSMGSMPNQSFRLNLMNQINVIKSTVLNFLKDLKELIPLNKNPYIEGTEYFEPIEAKKENDRIIDKISSKVYKYIEIDEKENKTNLETEGKFLYSIGGIARKSLDIANRLYSKLFEEYKRYLKDPTKINRNQLDKKNLSRWVKNRFNVKEFIKNAAENHKQAIFKYNQYLVHKNDTDFLFEIFNDFLSLFLKCSLSIPMVEVKFLDDNNILDKPINNQEMIDLIIKNRSYKVNFCFLPQLTSNEGLIPGAKFHVFTYNEPETYKLPDANYEIVKQNTELDYNFKY